MCGSFILCHSLEGQRNMIGTTNKNISHVRRNSTLIRYKVCVLPAVLAKSETVNTLNTKIMLNTQKCKHGKYLTTLTPVIQHSHQRAQGESLYGTSTYPKRPNYPVNPYEFPNKTAPVNQSYIFWLICLQNLII